MDAGEVSNVNSELPIFGCNQAIAVGHVEAQTRVDFSIAAIGEKEMAAGV